MPRARAGGPQVVWLGASEASLQPYVLSPNAQQPYQRTPVSEYAAPIRLGQPDYDARLVASTIAFEDYAAGLGRYFPDSRQEKNRSWFSSADTRNAGIASLPPKFTSRALPSQPGSTGRAASLARSSVSGTPMVYLAAGNKLYRVSGVAWANVITIAAATKNQVANGSFEVNTAGWTIGVGASAMVRDTTLARYLTASGKFTVTAAGGSIGTYALTFATAGYKTISAWVYLPSTNLPASLTFSAQGYTGAVGTTSVAADMTKVDQWQRLSFTMRVVAGDLIGTLDFTAGGTGVAGPLVYVDGVQAEDGQVLTSFSEGAGTAETWRLREVTVVDDGPNAVTWLVWCRPDGTWSTYQDPTVAGNWAMNRWGDMTDVIVDPSTANRMLYLTVEGDVKYYDHTLLDDVYVGSIPGGGHFLGTMQGVAYMVDGVGTLWDYDPSRNLGTQVRAYPDALPNLLGGCSFQNAQLALTDGRRVVLWHPTRPSREVTPGAPDGLPASMANTIRGLFPVGDRLLARVDLTGSTATQLLEYKGGGWHVFSQGKSGTWMGTTSAGLEQRRQTDSGFILDPDTQRHWLSVLSGGVVGTYENALPAGGDVPWVQEQITAGAGFEPSARLETGWHHLGLRGLSGPILQARALGEFPDLNCSIAVWYKLVTGILDDTAAWQALGTLHATQRALLLNTGQGLEFRVARFAYDLALTGGSGGGTSTVGPNAIVGWDYLKVPDQLTRRVFQFDVELTARHSKRAAQTIFDDLMTLAGPGPLPLCRVGDEPLTPLKLEAPRGQGYLDARNKQAGYLIVSGLEVA